jgi:hypothetical protein
MASSRPAAIAKGNIAGNLNSVTEAALREHWRREAMSGFRTLLAGDATHIKLNQYVSIQSKKIARDGTLALLGALMAVFAWTAAGFSAAWPLPLLLAACAALGATAIGWNGVYLAEVAHVAAPGQAGLATGGCLFFTYVGVVFCPFLFGVLQRASGSYALAFAIAGGVCAATAAGLVRKR